jgi:hypothetical protein
MPLLPWCRPRPGVHPASPAELVKGLEHCGPELSLIWDSTLAEDPHQVKVGGLILQELHVARESFFQRRSQRW